MQLCNRLAVFLLVLGLLVCPNPARAAVPELIEYRAIPAADGSVAIELDFDTFAPPFQVIHAKRNDVKVILGNVERGRNLPGVFGKNGSVRSGVITQFPGIGLVLDLQLDNDVTPRGESAGNRVIVHIPAKGSDKEAAFTLSAKEASEGVKIIRLSYADVSEVAGLIKEGMAVPSTDNFTAQSPFAAPTPNPNSSSSYGSSSAASAAPQTVTIPTYALLPKDTAQGVYVNPHVSVDRRLNAVILRGSDEEIAPYERMIALIDSPRRSVLLDTQIVELTETAALDLGINFSAGTGSHLITGTSSAGNTSGVTNPVTGNAVTVPQNKISATATLDALASRGEAKILAQPKIVAVDNRIAAILSGEAVPIYTTVTVPNGGGAILQQQLQYINVGVSLEILPRISSSGDVTADLFSEVSSIIDYVPQGAPRIAVRQELTAVQVQDGQSVLIGGLLQDLEIKSISKIPGLGDIPLLGQLFRDTQTSHQKTNLYIVITPHVLTKTAGPLTAPPPNQ